MSITLFGKKIRLELVLILCVFLGWFIGVNTFCSCKKEGYDNLLTSEDMTGVALQYSMGDGVKSSLEKPIKQAQKSGGFMNWDKTGETFPGAKIYSANVFANTKFSPDCCPSTYSNDMGCVCASKEQWNYLNERGGNRTLTSEY